MRPRPTVVEAVLARWAPVASVMDSGGVALSRALAPRDCAVRQSRPSEERPRGADYTERPHSPRHGVPAAPRPLHGWSVAALERSPRIGSPRISARRWAAALAMVADRRDARRAHSSRPATSMPTTPRRTRRAAAAPMTTQHVLLDGNLRGADGHPSALLAHSRSADDNGPQLVHGVGGNGNSAA